MVNPVLIVAITLGGAFLIGIISLIKKSLVSLWTYLVLIADLFISASLFYHFYKGASPFMIKIGGFAPPIGISLYADVYSAFISTLVFLVGIIALFHAERHGKLPVKFYVLFMLLSVGAVGMVFTQDFFNLFVFIEITSIAAYGLVASRMDAHSLESAFKYLVIGSISSMFVLLGAVFIYKFAGNLNMLYVSSVITPSAYKNGFILISLIFLFGIFVELELFPINGWALDIYQSANPAVVVILSGAILKAFYVVFLRTVNYLHFPYIVELSLIFGLSTYLIGHLIALKQTNIRRLFGYSSVAQIGLLLVAGAFYLTQTDPFIKKVLLSSIVLFILNHTFSKGTLFFVSDNKNIIDVKDVEKLGGSGSFMFKSSLLSMAGAPPFAGFWAKLLLIMAIPVKYYYVALLILIGAIVEIVYYMRIFRDIKGEDEEFSFSSLSSVFMTVFVYLTGLLGVYLFINLFSISLPVYVYYTIFGFFVILITGKWRILQYIITVLSLVFIAYKMNLSVYNLSGFFTLFILLGGALLLFATYPSSKKYSYMFYPFVFITLLSMTGISLSLNWIALFIFWEFMSWASFMLIDEGNKKSAWIYIVMGVIGGYAMLAGIKLLIPNYIDLPLFSEAPIKYGILSATLIFTAFLVKMATVPLHIWAKDAYRDSPHGFTPILSGIMSKMGVFGAIITIVHLIPHISHSDVVLYGLAWLGALTAFFMTLLAIFEEDAKEVLAYSSVAQVGYILIGLSLATGLGYTAALYHTINHFIFKGALFIAIMGVAYRTGTTYLPELGGLIKRMPFTFFAFLVSIIALSGVPPLSGTGGKWLLYTALLEKGWMFVLVVAMLASTAAFLYCYKLLHAIFLGQLKEKHHNVKEAPIFVVLGEITLAVGTMIVGMNPQLILNMTEKIIKNSMHITDLGYRYEGAHKIVSAIGYWNAWAIMIFVMGSFITALVFFIITRPKIRWVGQLDIGYSGEVPESPESVHVGSQMYMHVRRAIWFLVSPFVSRIYKSVYASIIAVADYVRKIYTGDINTYAIWVIVTFVFIFMVFVKGVF